MLIQTKVIAIFIFIPLFFGAQGSSSCRRSPPSNSSTSDPRAASNTNSTVNNNQRIETPPTKPTQRIPAGTWGGDQIRIVAGHEGADIEYNCAHGTINAPLEVDREGRFDLRGTHRVERSGPTRLDKNSPGRPAKYEGRVEDKQMTLKVTFADDSEPIGEFTLILGNAGRLRKCL